MTVSRITKSEATLDWTANIEPDGDAITYNVEFGISPVELGNSPKITSLTNTRLQLSGLVANQTYSVQVIAVDIRGGQSTARFDFITIKNN